ncbi:MAG: hypothetical protein U0528_02775 [Anaerolineae bacterium]
MKLRMPLIIVLLLLQAVTRLSALLQMPPFIDETGHLNFALEVLSGRLFLVQPIASC